MKRTIMNPHRVNHKIYIYLTAISLIVLFTSYIIPTENSKGPYVFAEVIKNLSYGCIASTVVAWIIDCTNIKNLNQKANNVYDAIYGDLRFQIGSFIGAWAELCVVAFEDKDYHLEKHTWDIWYKTVKENYYKCEPERQEHLLDFFYRQLAENERTVNRSIEYLQSQRHMLTLNDAMNDDMERILSDFQFEFHALHLDLSRKDTPELFWTHMDAITKDLINYIENWSDIRYYNFLIFKPYEFFKKTDEMFVAVLACEHTETIMKREWRIWRKWREWSKWRKLVKEVSGIKKAAKREARDSAYLQIKNATKALQEFYNKPRIKNDKNFLLWRYTKLEKKDRIWTLFIVPVLISIFSISIFSFEWLSHMFTALETDTNNFIDTLQLISQSDLLTKFKYYVPIAIFVLCITYIVFIIKKVSDSLTRNPDTTIIENELNILRSILQKHEILFSENIEYKSAPLAEEQSE